LRAFAPIREMDRRSTSDEDKLTHTS
jgi:hypothetical protein